MARAKQAVIIGGGFAGLSAASYMARAGYRVVLLEKNPKVGGRAQFAEDAGFKFNLGPSWYIMPDIYEDFFRDFGASPEDHYTLTRLSPGFRSFSGSGKQVDALEPERMAEQLDFISPGDGLGFKRLLNRSKVVYSSFKLNLLQESWLARFVGIKPKIRGALSKMPKGSLAKRNAEFLKSPEARTALDSLSFFFGGSPTETPADYSFLPYTVFEQGVWYPGGGFNSVVEAFRKTAQQLGVEIYEGYEVEKIEVQYGAVSAVIVKGLQERIPADVVISASDYFASENLLDPGYQSYDLAFWKKQKYSPSAIVASFGLDIKLPGILHHNTFKIADTPPGEGWPAVPSTFYVSCPSFTDPSLAPNGGEVLTVTIPIPSGLQEEMDAVKSLVDQAMQKLSEVCAVDLNSHIRVQHLMSSSYFRQMFKAPGGSGFGLAQVKEQIFKNRPRLKSKKLPNLFYAGQDTNPGSGVQFAIVSGKLAAYTALGKKPEVRL